MARPLRKSAERNTQGGSKSSGEHFMSEEQATAIAEALGGKAWQNGGDVGVVLVRCSDGHLVLSQTRLCECESQETFDAGKPRRDLSTDQL